MSPVSAGYTAALEEVCTGTVGPDAPHVDQNGAFPDRSLNALCAAGLMGAVSAPEVGGLGLGFRGAAEIVGRLARECGSTAMVTCMHYCGTAVLEAFGPATSEAAAKGAHLSTLIQRIRVLAATSGPRSAPRGATAMTTCCCRRESGGRRLSRSVYDFTRRE